MAWLLSATNLAVPTASTTASGADLSGTTSVLQAAKVAGQRLVLLAHAVAVDVGAESTAVASAGVPRAGIASIENAKLA